LDLSCLLSSKGHMPVQLRYQQSDVSTLDELISTTIGKPGRVENA
jgi:hypothetical protein